jgi:arsenite oxidase small subunit
MEAPKPQRRAFLKAGGSAIAGTALIPIHAAHAASRAPDSQNLATLPKQMAGKARALPLNQASVFHYPDAQSPCHLLRLGHAVPGGVGPNGDIVAYSAMCTHMGCPVNYQAASQTFKCGCHYSSFDAEHGGQQICGQATRNLPRIVLEYDAKTDAVHAIGIDGLLYGRQSNRLGGAA